MRGIPILFITVHFLQNTGALWNSVLETNKLTKNHQISPAYDQEGTQSIKVCPSRLLELSISNFIVLNKIGENVYRNFITIIILSLFSHTDACTYTNVRKKHPSDPPSASRADSNFIHLADLANKIGIAPEVSWEHFNHTGWSLSRQWSLLTQYSAPPLPNSNSVQILSNFNQRLAIKLDGVYFVCRSWIKLKLGSAIVKYCVSNDHCRLRLHPVWLKCFQETSGAIPILFIRSANRIKLESALEALGRSVGCFFRTFV